MAPPAGLRRTKKPTKAADEQNTAIKAATIVVGVCLVGVLLTLWPESETIVGGTGGAGAYGGKPNAALEDFFKSTGITFSGARVLCSDKCRLVTTRPVKQGETLMKIPQGAIVDARFINETDAGKAMFQDEAAILKTYAGKETLGPSFANMFQYAFYFAMEKRDVASEIAGWLNALPSLEGLPSALTWDERMEECVDSHVASEAKSLRGILAAAVSASAEICEVDANKPLCGGNPPTEAELRWALSVYLHYNFQDQAILMGANFAMLNNGREGMTPQFDQGKSMLNMVSGSSFQGKGEAVVINFARGPGTLLVSQGFFDKSSSGVDARIRIPDARQDPLAKKYCADKYSELIFGHNGKPRESLVNCIGYMVADKEQKKGNFKANMKKDKNLRMYTFGNLTGLLQNSHQSMSETLQNAAKASHCHADSSPLAAQMSEYRDFVSTVLTKNMEHCNKMYYSFGPPPPQGEFNSDDEEVITGGTATISPDAEEDAPMDTPETP